MPPSKVIPLWISDVGRFAVIGVIASAIGFSINALRPSGLPLIYESVAAQHVAVATPSESAHRLISLEETRSLLGRPDVVILDARPEVFFRVGHIPGAVSLPREDFSDQFRILEGRLRSPNVAGIVIYCSGGDCEDSMTVAEGLAAQGIGHLAIFTGGWEEWSAQEKMSSEKQ